MLLMLLAVMSSASGEEAPWSEAAERFMLGPVPPKTDLRNMLNEYLVRRSCAALDATVQRRHAAFGDGDWQAWRDTVRASVREGLGPMPFGYAGGPLNVRFVSCHEQPGYVLENVLFESLDGLDVNASVYLPLEAEFPPPWIPIVVPVGHSAKTRPNYQLPAQVFARMGYVAVTFDPPDMAGEKRTGNDHFVDGVRCYLTGHSSNRYFVIDAVRCIDYLETRPDVNVSRGVGMTGVSGGGFTTMFATLLDDRIAASGPACCAVPNALHPIIDMYAPCPETLAIGRFNAYDDVDLLAAAVPAPVLLMAGAADEVFTESMSRAIAEEVDASYESAGLADRFSFFLDPGGHAYTVTMALEFVRWMDRWVRGEPDRVLPEVNEADLEVLPDDMLACGPRQNRNILSINRDMALALEGNRSGLPIDEAVRLVAHVDGPVPSPAIRAGEPSLCWFHHVQELMIEPESGIELPATYLVPARPDWKGGAVLYLDDRGRWTDLRQQGLLASITGALDENTNGPAVLTVDLRGWGDTRPADTNYDVAGWAHRERWTAYVSAGLGDHVLAMRIRDGLAALAHLRSRNEIDAERIVVGGRGMGGIVALHVAAVDSELAGAFAIDGLATFGSLATSNRYAWSPEAFLPDVLRHYDLPELVAGLDMPCLIANPLGAAKEPLEREEAKKLYGDALDRGDAAALSRFVRTCVTPNKQTK